ncbi:uncharacterized protein LOC114132680 isoform X10 [Aphis gossypii]|uniref:uncharacterized protein LOC114132680 isoform X7 n=1 Tax=Aphis gossypii TaxID=80765 RepID=UPI002158F550|nr:uncharacterized protein LOC114132680 isoform X7 [Aphis gossypii]XP_050062590.1 uncharacterized protein LOC114132680 isoform X8 [Aphis gossypii]XP_050062591.1 uncharacterized protein LOC114132680 isoform X9 [Aphis gossypii]XP_050062592.1 uncharacterized protein LOC114132680 isoform X10 [Aphis gossypii]
MSVSYFWNDSLPRCGLCANRFGMHPLRFYKFFDDSINGVKINEVLSNMFPYGKYSRADMKSELICQRCYTQAVEMSRRDTKWVDCFKEMDEIKNQFSHLRGRDDFDYFLNPTTNNPSTSAAPSTIVSGSTYNENSLGNRPLSTAPATIVSGSTSNENNLAPATIVSGSTSNENNLGNCLTFQHPSTTFTENQYRSIFSAPATIVSGSTSNENNLAPATIVSGSTSNEDDPESSITVNENDNEDISDNLSTASESSNASESSSTTLSENEYQEESTNMMNCTFNTCINIMSNRVYSKSGAFYSCIIPSCKLFFKTFYKFKLHYRQHRNVNGMVCWTCIKVLPNRSKMRKHKNKDSCKFPGMFVCVSCKESFNDLQSISHHKYIKHIKN